MLWLAASVAIAQATSARIEDPALAAAWAHIEPSVVVIERGSAKKGTAALISDKGFFITGNSVVAGAQTVHGRFFDGHQVTLFLVAIDGPTQLALLRAYEPIGNRPVVPMYDQGAEKIDADHPKSVIAALPTGPITAELVNTRALALLRSQRAVSILSEVHFESAANRVAGSPIFTSDGALVGVLQATLENVETRPLSRGGLEGFPMPAVSQPLNVAPHDYGPAGMTVAYSPGPSVLQRVVKGLLSPNHAVLRPAIGIWCRDAKRPGALVDAVLDGSPAWAAGIKEGDIIVQIEASPIRNQVEFGRVMLQQVVGSDIHVALYRNGKLMNFRVRVGM